MECMFFVVVIAKKNTFESKQKLGQLEDIEEELGIDLILLYKCMLKHFVYRKLYNGRIVEDKFRYDEAGFNGQYGVYDLKDYGKTWALTREELE